MDLHRKPTVPSKPINNITFHETLGNTFTMTSPAESNGSIANSNTRKGTQFRRIWIGGTSGLARSYCNAFQSARKAGRKQNNPTNEPWLLLGQETRAPTWIANFNGLFYRQVDFTKTDEEGWQKFLRDECSNVEHVVLSIRPPLVSQASFSQATKRHQQMVNGLQLFLQILLSTKNTVDDDDIQNNRTVHIVHASSIAAIGHVQEQRLRSEASLADPISSALYHPYDRFKRRCEEVLDELVEVNPHLLVTHVRLGAIFSDIPHCIQCSALALQAHIGFDVKTRIDCNSARNVATLLRAVMEQSPPAQALRYFYYTRPLSFPMPIRYGAYLLAYRRAYNIRVDFWLPLLVLHWIVRAVHACAAWWPALPFLQSIDYLLQVTRHEHTFDLSLVGAAYPSVVAQEESILECFQRRRYYLRDDL